MRRHTVEPRTMWQTSAPTQLPPTFLSPRSIGPHFLHVLAVLNWFEVSAEACNHGPRASFDWLPARLPSRGHTRSLGYGSCLGSAWAHGRRPRAPRQLGNGCLRLHKQLQHRSQNGLERFVGSGTEIVAHLGLQSFHECLRGERRCLAASGSHSRILRVLWGGRHEGLDFIRDGGDLFLHR